MEDENKVVEATTTETTASVEETKENEVDYEVELEKVNKRLAQAEHKIAEQRLKIKSQKPIEDEEDSESLDILVDRKLNEKLAQSDLTQAQEEKEKLLKQALKRNKELETALKNRSQIVSTGSGTSSEGMEVQDTSLSKEQLDNLKKRGWDDARIERFKKTLQKNKGL